MLTFIIPIKVKTLTAEILQLFSMWPPMLSPSERVMGNSSELLRICWVSSPRDNLQGRHFYVIFQIRKLKLRNTCWKSASHSYSLDKPLSLLSTPEFLLHIRKWTHDLLYLRFTDPSGFSGLTSVLSFQNCGIPGLGLEAWHSDDSCSLSSPWLNLIYTCSLFIEAQEEPVPSWLGDSYLGLYVVSLWPGLIAPRPQGLQILKSQLRRGQKKIQRQGWIKIPQP